MAVFGNSHPMVMAAIFLIAGIMIWGGNNVVSGQCKGDLNGLIEHCAEYVQKGGPKVEPSKSCCQVLKTVDVPCVCDHIPKAAEQIISIDKAVYVVEFCGMSLPHGMKCGSYTVP